MAKKRKVAKRPVISFIMIIVCILSSAFLIYSLSLLNGIETLIRILLSTILVVLSICFMIGFTGSVKAKNKKYIFYTILGVIYSSILLVFGYYIQKTYSIIGNLTTDSSTYSTSLVALSDNKVKDIKKVKGKIGIIEDEDNVVGYQIPMDIIDENKLDVETEKYTSYIDIITALYDEKIDYAFLPTNYVIMFSNYEGSDFSKLGEDTKIIYTKDKKVTNKDSNKTTDLKDPFTILLMGVDSENEEIAGSSFNGDSLMLLTFNPNTLNMTILSIPRDTYVPIACFSGKSKSKITHAAWYGEKCMMETIEDFTGINIDYFVKVNFKGLVKIVDYLGGVDVDVPYSFCEQNSNREFGNGTVYVEEGFQTLDGEQALAFSRNRHPWPEYCSAKYSNYNSNDFIRGQNQQTVLKAILNKIKEKASIDTIINLLDEISNSMETNMQTNQILSLYNVFKDVFTKVNGKNFDDAITIQRLYLSGVDAYIYDTNVGMTLYNFVYYSESLDEVTEAMKVNLEIEKPKAIKTFSFDIDDEYEENVIGKMDSGTPIKYSTEKPEAKKEETKKEENKKEETKDKEETKKEDDKDKDDDKDLIEVPNFVGLTYKEALKKANAIDTYLNPATNDDDAIVVTQDVAAGTKIEKGLTIKLTFKTDDKKETEETEE